MRKILLLLIIGVCINAIGQDEVFNKSTFKGDLYRYFGTKITYPMKLVSEGITGFTEIDFRISENGRIDSVHLVKTPTKELGQKAIYVLSRTRDMWTPTSLNGENISCNYKIIIEHRIVSEKELKRNESIKLLEKAKKNLKKGKADVTLDIINKALVLSPYNHEMYFIRAEAYRLLNENEKMDIDLKRSKNIEKSIIGPIVVVAVSYGNHSAQQ